MSIPAKPETDYYFQCRREILEHVPINAKTLLDVGSAGGAFAGELKRRQKIIIQRGEKGWRRPCRHGEEKSTF